MTHSTHPPTSWHAMPVNDTFKKLHTQKIGLTKQEIQQRLKKHGRNIIEPPKKRSLILRFFSQFHHLLIYILILSATITAVLNNWTDTVVIVAVVLINAFIGVFQEGKAEHAIASVQKLLSQHATVLRNHERLSILAEELVPGDIVILNAGDKVPADIRLFHVERLQINESLLTGEANAIEKTILPLPESVIIGDRTNMAFSGTLVTMGQGLGIVVATGSHTEVGRISQLLTTVKPLVTPLIRKITRFSQYLAIFIVVLTIFIFLYGLLYRGLTIEAILMAAVSIAVAAIPEGLPIILTITFAIGVERMAKRHAIIRRLPAVESLGSVMIICSDKTGTLTRNEMVVQAVTLSDIKLTVSGDGYDNKGEFYQSQKKISPDSHKELFELCKASALCNDAHFHSDGPFKKLEGDPTEGALITLAEKAKIQLHDLRVRLPRIDAIPFSSEHRLMCTLHHDTAEKIGIIYVKGAPEIILNRCRFAKQQDKNIFLDKTYWHNQIHKLAEQGLRTLAIAYKLVSSHHKTLHLDDIESGLILLGLVGISDPPRREAIQAIQQCKTAGIRIKMITGDHAITARTIARKMGIGDGLHVLTGEEIDRMTDVEFFNCVDNTDVFARTSPEHKLRLVKALQAKHYSVAVTGDGVNDALALKRANIGVAMGLKGTEVAKEASEMVLTDDNFASIVDAIKEGRTVYDNLKKAITFILPVNGGESLSIALAILLSYTLPITPIQILWVNMVGSVLLTLSLAFEPSEPDVMERPPVPQDQSLLSLKLIWRILLVSTTFLAGIFGIFRFGINKGFDLETARTMAVNTLVILEIFYLISSRYLHGLSFSRRGMHFTKAVFFAICATLFLQGLFTYLPLMQHFFNTRPLTALQISFVMIVGALGFIVVEINKLIGLAIQSRK